MLDLLGFLSAGSAEEASSALGVDWLAMSHGDAWQRPFASATEHMEPFASIGGENARYGVYTPSDQVVSEAALLQARVGVFAVTDDAFLWPTDNDVDELGFAQPTEDAEKSVSAHTADRRHFGDDDDGGKGVKCGHRAMSDFAPLFDDEFVFKQVFDRFQGRSLRVRA